LPGLKKVVISKGPRVGEGAKETRFKRRGLAE